MAGVDHNILWYLNGKYQPDFEGYTTFVVHPTKKRKTGSIIYTLKERELPHFCKAFNPAVIKSKERVS